MASTQGPVFPVEEQGSRVTTRVSHSCLGTPLIEAAWSASTSACAAPQARWNPCPITSPPERTAAPTQGLGATSKRYALAASPRRSRRCLAWAGSMDGERRCMGKRSARS